MNKSLRYLFRGLFIATLIAADVTAFASTASRSAVNMENARATSTVSSRTKQQTSQRGATQRPVRSGVAVSTNRSGLNPLNRAVDIIGDAGNVIIRRALNMGRSATDQKMSARTAKPAIVRSGSTGASRARATAVFSDVSKLGEGYNKCRDAYNTCMDQFCAGANETYRRCFCSNNFRNLRNQENALDSAKDMLARFENNNLDAVTKSAEEVNAMYSATAGELAIKNDTSAAANMLSEINDLLSGRTQVYAGENNLSSLSTMTLTADDEDIWNTDDESLFSAGVATDLSALEGAELYNRAAAQCAQLVNSSCETGAVRNMVKSAYSILITQDCNVYQKKLDSKTEQVKSTVRTAEKYLREARLEEYRAHNSSDVNECMDKVEQAILAPTACGPSYEKCLDNTGAYINSTTGEPIYSPRLFKLNNLITLDGTSADVLRQNTEFNKFLDSKRSYAKSALDTCRDIADTVWSEFKRNALIRIAQAQDEKIEEVKMSCVNTMKECYDSQSDALKGFDDTTAQTSGALAARAARDMCVEKVVACAALYGDTDRCSIDNNGHIINGTRCGLAALLKFVDTVDDTRIAEGCVTAVQTYLRDLCTPSVGTEGYPWNCRLKRFSDTDNDENPLIDWTYNLTNRSTNTLVDMVIKYANDMCGETVSGTNQIERSVQTKITRELENVRDQLEEMIGDKCDAAGGMWVNQDTVGDLVANSVTSGGYLENFYTTTFGKIHQKAEDDYGIDSLGVCVVNDVRARCLAEDIRTGSNGYATYNATTGQCVFTTEYYRYQCSVIDGVWDEFNRCYIER